MTTNIDGAVAKKMGFTSREIDRTTRMAEYDWKEIVWFYPDGREVGIYVPKFSTDWNATKILIRWMRGEGYQYDVKGSDEFGWMLVSETVYDEPNYSAYVDIKDDNLPLAACEAFLNIPDEDLEVKG